jgi:hypothetical protein
VNSVGGAQDEELSFGRHARRGDPHPSAPSADEEVLRSGGADRGARRPAAPRGTAADLRLLRTDARLRAWAVAAVLGPFVAYFLLVLAIGRTDRFVLFVWAPIVLAGILLGAVLDIGHRRVAAAPAAGSSGSAS